jgi:glycosyltransferase involved in cell wall biosynthesis
MKISYAILACNEARELNELLTALTSEIRKSDEIVIVLDETSVTKKVEFICESYKRSNDLQYYTHPLNKDFAAQKNYLTSKCSGDWIVNLDADELLTPDLIRILPDIIEMNEEVDVVWMPRINTVEGITPDHIEKWNWQVNEKGWVNWPDAQMRIYKNNGFIKWVQPVHERLTGHKSFGRLPFDAKYAIHHHKNITKQESQNEFYKGI